jgi:hypothetical protein
MSRSWIPLDVTRIVRISPGRDRRRGPSCASTDRMSVAQCPRATRLRASAHRRTRRGCSRIARSPAGIAVSRSSSLRGNRPSSPARGWSTTRSDAHRAEPQRSVPAPWAGPVNTTPRSVRHVAARRWSRSLQGMIDPSTAAGASTRSVPASFRSPPGSDRGSDRRGGDGPRISTRDRRPQGKHDRAGREAGSSIP